MGPALTSKFKTAWKYQILIAGEVFRVSDLRVEKFFRALEATAAMLQGKDAWLRANF